MCIRDSLTAIRRAWGVTAPALVDEPAESGPSLAARAAALKDSAPVAPNGEPTTSQQTSRAKRLSSRAQALGSSPTRGLLSSAQRAADVARELEGRQGPEHTL